MSVRRPRVRLKSIVRAVRAVLRAWAVADEGLVAAMSEDSPGGREITVAEALLLGITIADALFPRLDLVDACLDLARAGQRVQEALAVGDGDAVQVAQQNYAHRMEPFFAAGAALPWPAEETMIAILHLSRMEMVATLRDPAIVAGARHVRRVAGDEVFIAGLEEDDDDLDDALAQECGHVGGRELEELVAQLDTRPVDFEAADEV
jgi:hypothetical protein